MLAFRRISFLISFLAFALFAMATPSKRQGTADIESILTNLQTITQPIVAELKTLNAGNATSAEVDPLITRLNNAFQASTEQITALPPSLGRSIKRQSADDIASLIASIIADVTVALSVFVDLDIQPLLVALDVAINELLVGLAVLVDGILVLVAQLLVDVTLVLTGLGLGLILGLLGL